MGKNMFKRIMASVLALAMVLTMVQYRPLHVHALGTLTSADVVANNHPEIGTQEKNVLLSGGLKTETFTYEVPTDSSLVKVDPKALTIKAATFTDDYGNVWYPEKAYVTGQEEPYTLTNGEATFTAAGNQYSVKVTYRTYVEIATEEQERLLNTAYALYDAKYSLDALLGTEANLNLLAPLIPDAYKTLELAVEAGESIPADFMEAFKALNEQVKDDNAFTLNDMITSYYDNYNNYVEYFYSEDVVALRAEAIALSNLLNVIYNYEEHLPFNNSQLRALDALVTYLSEGADPEYWNPLYVDGTPLVDLEADLTVLESVVVNRKFKDLDTYEATEEKLLLAETEIEATVAMHEVEVKLVANTFDKNGNANPLTSSVTLTVKDGATVAEIEELVKEFTTDKLNQWNTALGLLNVDYAISLDNYNYAATPNSGKEITELTLTYSPKTYSFTITDGDATVSTVEVAYGEFVELPKATEGEYEYLINDVNYKQGVSVRVLGNTVAVRSEGKAKVEGLTIFDVIAQDSYYGLNSITAEILSNDALKSPVAEYRVLAEGDVTITLKEVEGGFLLTAPTYSAGVADMEWAPVSYSVNGSTEKVAMTGTTATIEGLVENVKVYYELKITQNSSTGDIYDVDANLKDWINLPYTLVEETKEQLAVLNRLAAMADPNSDSGYLSMGSLINTALNLLQDQYDDKNLGKYGHDDYEKYSAQDKKEYLAILEIKEKAFAGANLKIYNYINKYIELGDKGLAAYYGNENGYNQYKEQLDILAKNLRTVVESDEFDNVKTNPDFSKFEEQINKVGDITTELESIVLVKPNAYVDHNHADFGALLDALQGEAAKDVMHFDTVNGLRSYYDEKVSNSDLYFTYNVVVDVNGTQYKDSISVLKHTNLTQANVDEITEIVNTLLAGVDTVHNEVGKYKLPTTSTKVTADTTLTVKVTAKDYTIKYVNENGGKISETEVQFGNRNETLAASTKTDEYYVYTVNGTEYNTKDGDKTLYITTNNFDSLFVDGVLTITRVTNSIAQEQLGELETFVNDLNAAFNGMNTEVELVKVNGENKLVLAVDASEASQLSSTLMSFGMTLLNSKYKVIALGEENNVFYDAFKSEITVQALINALLYSDLDSAQLNELFNADGSINNNANKAIGISPLARSAKNYGGLLLESVMFLTNDEGTLEHELPFFLTVKANGSNETVKDADKVLEELSKYVKFDTENDKFNFELTLPNKGYEALLATMILAGYADLEDVTATKFDKLVEYVVAQYDELINNKDVELNDQVIQNTLDKLGIDVSVKGYAKYINMAVKALRHLKLSNDGETLVGDVQGDTYAVLSKVVPASFLSMLNANVSVPTTAKLTNVGTSYDAIIVDLFNETKKVYTRVDFSSNIENDIANLADNSVVILLKDADELNVKENVVLNLNGNNVKSISVADNAHLRIFDSAFADGTVNAVEGKNITITGGVYQPAMTFFGLRSKVDVSAYLPEGYVQNSNGAVSHQFYSITETSDGIVIEVNPDIENISKQDLKDMDYAYLAADLALTLGLRYYNASSLTINGYEIAGVTEKFGDLVGLYADSTVLSFANDVVDLVNCKGIQDFVNNELIAKLTDFETLAKNVRADGTIAEYTIATNPLTIGLDLVKDSEGNYLTGGFAQNTALTKSDKFIIRVNKTTADKYLVADMLDILADVLTVDGKLTLTKADITKLTGSDISGTTDLAADGKVAVEFKDAKYTVLMAAILAYGTNDDALYNALKAYICENDTVGLKKAIEKHTVAEMYNSIVLATSKDVTLADMFGDKIALTDYKGAAEAESILDAYLAVAMKGVKFLGAHDSTRKIVVKGDATRTFKGRVTATVVLDLIADNKDHEHIYGEWKEVKPATCTETGLEERICTICGKVDTREIALLDHTYTTTVVPPTCTEDGYTRHECACGHFYDDEFVPATGHAPHIVGAVKATCTEEGYTGDTVCQNCGELIEKGTVVPAHGHKYVNGVCIYCGDKLPSTGDSSLVGLYAALAMVNLAAIVFLKRKRDLLKR